MDRWRRMIQDLEDIRYDIYDNIRSIVNLSTSQKEDATIEDTGFLAWLIDTGDYNTQEILQKPWAFSLEKRAYEIKEELGLEGDVSEVVDDIISKFNPAVDPDSLAHRKKEPKEYPSKAWDKWYDEAQEKGYDI